MTDTATADTDTTTVREPTDDRDARIDADRAPDDARGGRNERDERIRAYLYRGALVLLVLFAVVALFQFYTSALAVIRTFVADRYRPLFNAAFNLAVLLTTGIGISYVVRRMD
ncbi:hypothetical protein [Haladaptatus salinisoli]|uniref:hypothetical protein n=1 Tax=Haladaptatus salinisoli TaxID=2884876 RepID=UPI001D0B605D|nr:hypothetical protein [Haladaptatus salinisoli]